MSRQAHQIEGEVTPQGAGLASVLQRNAVLKDALSVVKISATRASTELVALLDEDDASLRRLVCRDILDRAIKIYDIEDIETRLTAVERSLKQNRRSYDRAQ